MPLPAFSTLLRRASSAGKNGKNDVTPSSRRVFSDPTGHGNPFSSGDKIPHTDSTLDASPPNFSSTSLFSRFTGRQYSNETMDGSSLRLIPEQDQSAASTTSASPSLLTKLKSLPQTASTLYHTTISPLSILSLSSPFTPSPKPSTPEHVQQQREQRRKKVEIEKIKHQEAKLQRRIKRQEREWDRRYQASERRLKSESKRMREYARREMELKGSERVEEEGRENGEGGGEGL